MQWRKYLYLLLFIAVLTGCDKNRVFEENQDIPNNSWQIRNVPQFSFVIEDPATTYNIYFNVRNAIFYEFYNLYMRAELIGPNGKPLDVKLHEMYLMDKTTGKPLGDGAGDIFDHQFLAIKNFKFPQAGTYKVRLKQYMRRDPLPGIMAVGVRVEKVNP
ncbi:gliding motility lipoprotein GldH [Adhaeribacter swui]|uniref:Gliding motility lipoprotein GldH n=1 Tax=Adhaeribacter swui TaxID=2086471 RepID=A0A7G7G560_9BACT|nr:gliding motility lipoprotein GldH [Adhaeribacter swui]QNF32294.1 gliding motility lipoprotein GldH [Adhaeribacter swui]